MAADSVAESATALVRCNVDELNKKFRLIKYPLSYFGEAFKTIFSNVLGFEWFIKYSYQFNLPRIAFSLPTIMYDPHLYRFLNFGIGSKLFLITPLNFWAIPLNYIARNLGKLVGWALVSLFTIPAYIAINTYYGIKRIVLDKQVNDLLKNSNPQEIAHNWFKQAIAPSVLTSTRIAEYVDSSSLFTGLIMHHNDKIAAAIQNSHSAEFVPTEANKYTYQEYCTTRNNVLLNEERKFFFGTILTGIFIFPLFFTIPAYKKLMLNHDAERNQQPSHMNILDEFIEIHQQREVDAPIADREQKMKEANERKNTPYIVSVTRTRDHIPTYQNDDPMIPYSNRDYDLYYLYGQKLFEKNSFDLAYEYYMKVPTTSEHYQEAVDTCHYINAKSQLELSNAQLAYNYFLKISEGSKYYNDAMSECGYYLLATGNPVLAHEYFTKAGEKNAIKISELLSNNPNATINEISQRHTEEKKASSMPKRPAQESGLYDKNNVMFPSIASSPEKKDIRGLDEDEEPGEWHSTQRRLSKGSNQADSE